MATVDSPPLVLHNVCIPSSSSSESYTLVIKNGHVAEVKPIAHKDSIDSPPVHYPYSTNVDCRNGLVLPSLCHPHVHLDKPYLLGTKIHPAIVKGDFNEALKLVTSAKKEYTYDDLLERGRRLILESVQAGVTCMRAHVEVDPTVGKMCLEAGLALKKEFGDEGKGLCDIQLAVFAQDAIWSDADTPSNERRHQFWDAASTPGVDVVGSAPYVEDSMELAQQNILWIANLAILHRKHLDLHLDYNLSHMTEPLIQFLITVLKEQRWPELNKSKVVTLGHCTRLSLFPPFAVRNLRDEIKASNLPIHFVGLPTSDLYMMGRDAAGGPSKGGGTVPRGTLPVLDWIKSYDLSCALSINNIGNAFTPFGSADPLAMLPTVGVVYQGGTEEDCKTLLECITNRAKRAIGLLDKPVEKNNESLAVGVSEKADMVIIGSSGRRKGMVETAVDPGLERIVVKNGKIVARREVKQWIAA